MVCWLCVGGAIPACPALGADVSLPWQIGPDFHRQLRMTCGIAWRGDPLRDALNNLSHEHRVAIFLDRRIDPNQRIDLSVRDVTLDELLQTLAKHLGIGMCRLENVIYVGPAATASALPVLSAVRMTDIKRASSELRRKLERTQAWSWPVLSEPRALIHQLTKDNAIALQRWEQIPHDLWPAMQLPQLTLCNRLILTLAGFGLTFEISPSRSELKLIAVYDVGPITRSYRLRGDVADQIKEMRARFPKSTIQAAGRQLTLTGSLQDHVVLAQLLESPKTTARRETPIAGRQVHSLRVEAQPVGTLLHVIARQLNFEVYFEPDTQPRLNQLVSLNVKNVSTEALFQAALEPAGLQHTLDGTRIIVSLAP